MPEEPRHGGSKHHLVAPPGDPRCPAERREGAQQRPAAELSFDYAAGASPTAQSRGAFTTRAGRRFIPRDAEAERAAAGAAPEVGIAGRGSDDLDPRRAGRSRRRNWPGVLERIGRSRLTGFRRKGRCSAAPAVRRSRSAPGSDWFELRLRSAIWWKCRPPSRSCWRRSARREHGTPRRCSYLGFWEELAGKVFSPRRDWELPR